MAPAVQRTLFDFDVPDDPPMHLITVTVDGCRHQLYSIDPDPAEPGNVGHAEWQHERKNSGDCSASTGGAG